MHYAFGIDEEESCGGKGSSMRALGHDLPMVKDNPAVRFRCWLKNESVQIYLALDSPTRGFAVSDGNVE